MRLFFMGELMLYPINPTFTKADEEEQPAPADLKDIPNRLFIHQAQPTSIY